MLYTTMMLMRPKYGAEFITTWNIPAGSISIPSQEGTYNCIVDWGDGTTSVHTTGALTHTYASAGIRQIKIYGKYNGFRINNDATIKELLLSIDQWGNVGFTSLERAFYGCSNLASLPTGAITGAEAVTSCRSCFNYCESLTSIPTGLFDKCIAVTDFSHCFRSCPSLTAIPTGLFDKCTAVTTFSYCFYSCTSLTGNAPTLWVSHASATGTQCFRYCDGLSNYSSIPYAWK